MKSVKYRPIQKKDYVAVSKILSKAFGLHGYVSDHKLLECFEMQYVYSCLSEATYTCIAELDDEIIGVIMGNSKTDYNILSHLPYILKTFYYNRKMQHFKKNDAKGIEDYHKVHKMYHMFSKKHKNEFDGVLTLFAVSENCRGLGVGKRLLQELCNYLKEQHTRRIYLYTDDTCNYSFYEHQGFERLEEGNLTLSKYGKSFLMKVFLYGYSL
ncbi:MAG: GNAT family N-acetyltransferase [Oscillospiraceae bacterium]|jgi:ribosomal protein S18 acetylase RimI-like enzyme